MVSKLSSSNASVCDLCLLILMSELSFQDRTMARRIILSYKKVCLLSAGGVWLLSAGGVWLLSAGGVWLLSAGGVWLLCAGGRWWRLPALRWRPLAASACSTEQWQGGLSFPIRKSACSAPGVSYFTLPQTKN